MQFAQQALQLRGRVFAIPATTCTAGHFQSLTQVALIMDCASILNADNADWGCAKFHGLGEIVYDGSDTMIMIPILWTVVVHRGLAWGHAGCTLITTLITTPALIPALPLIAACSVGQFVAQSEPCKPHGQGLLGATRACPRLTSMPQAAGLRINALALVPAPRCPSPSARLPLDCLVIRALPRHWIPLEIAMPCRQPSLLEDERRAIAR